MERRETRICLLLLLRMHKEKKPEVLAQVSFKMTVPSSCRYSLCVGSWTVCGNRGDGAGQKRMV